MKLYLNTAGEICELKLDEKRHERSARDGLAENIFSFIRDKLKENGATWRDITEIEFFTGPGSFTGLRIGAAVVNALADNLNIPIIDQNGKRHKIVLPEYGKAANISKPRK